MRNLDAVSVQASVAPGALARLSSTEPFMTHIILESSGRRVGRRMNLSTPSGDSAEAALAAYVLKTTLGGDEGQVVTMPREYAVRTGCCRYAVAHHVSVKGESLVRLECVEGDYDDAPDSRLKTIVLQFVGGCLDGANAP